jgi:hypothetical protein
MGVKRECFDGWNDMKGNFEEERKRCCERRML